MRRACDVCGKSYEAQRSTSKYCGSSCRVRKSQGAGKVAEIAPPEPGSGDVEVATRSELEQAGRVDTPLGQVALTLARRLDGSASDTGAAVAAVAKQLASTLEAATSGAEVADDPIDELRAARERKRAAAG